MKYYRGLLLGGGGEGMHVPSLGREEQGQVREGG